jgi:hypothetical protein
MPFQVGRWRQRFAPIIAAALRDLFAWNPGAEEKEAREVLREVYPKLLGRHHHPYKMWLKECRIQLDAHYRGRSIYRSALKEAIDPQQPTLF